MHVVVCSMLHTIKGGGAASAHTYLFALAGQVDNIISCTAVDTSAHNDVMTPALSRGRIPEQVEGVCGHVAADCRERPEARVCRMEDVQQCGHVDEMIVVLHIYVMTSSALKARHRT